jgi:hypothetical protein
MKTLREPLGIRYQVFEGDEEVWATFVPFPGRRRRFTLVARLQEKIAFGLVEGRSGKG